MPALRGAAFKVALTILARERRAGCELYISHSSAEAAFRQLEARRADIERLLGPGRSLPQAHACRIVHEAESLCKSLDDQRRLGHQCVYMCHGLYVARHPTEALAFGERAQAIAESLGDIPLQVMRNLYLGVAYHGTGNYRRAEDLFLKVLELLEGDLSRERFGLAGFPAVLVRFYLAWDFTERGEFKEGVAHAQEGIRLDEALDHPYSVAFAWWSLAYLEVIRGNSATPSARWHAGWRCVASGT